MRSDATAEKNTCPRLLRMMSQVAHPLYGGVMASRYRRPVERRREENTMRRFVCILSVLALFLGTANPALAAESIAGRMGVKALRGFANLTLGFVTEWPKTIYYESVEHGVPYGLTVGALKGVGWGVLRTGVGAYEVATFPVPVPRNYKPMLFPEFPHELREQTR
ncbi:MAG: exosortase system-associated protein, TIGR04073 family [Candidatus Methylomirabilia bacterium]